MEHAIYAGQMLAAQDQSPARQAATSAAVAELADMNVLFGLYRGRIYRYALLSLRDPELAESLTHDCLLRAHNARAQFRGDCSVATWLTRIATNLIRDHVRSRKLQFWKAATASAVDPADIVDRLRSHEPSPEASLLQREQITVLWQRVEKLSSKQRSVFLLRFVEELELSEIAAAMEMNISTVKSHLHRALQAVRAAMESNGTFSKERTAEKAR
jgi:RNA polymerase sigma-70 factor (ECF subfamily)